jgi:hypothetical protein
MSKSRFNATLRDGDAVGLTVDAIPLEGVTRCGIQDIDNQKISNTRQAFFFKTQIVVIKGSNASICHHKIKGLNS